MLIRAFVIASAVCMTSLAFNMAMAEDTATPSSQPAAISGVNFNDSESGLGAVARSIDFDFGFNASARPRQQLAPIPSNTTDTEGNRHYEMAMAASADVGGVPLDVGVAQRGDLQSTPEGDINRFGSGREVRIGQRLRNAMKGWGRSLVGRWRTPTWDHPTWYFFAAKDDEALAWTPGHSTGGHSVSYQEDRVEIGDRQAGIAIEAAGLQASFSYVERKIRGKYGSSEEDFAGVTLTWRR